MVYIQLWFRSICIVPFWIMFLKNPGNRVLLIEDSQGILIMVRNAYGVFKNNQLPKRFVLCENMHKNGVCTYQNACQFAHTLAEVTVWSFQKERGIRDHDQEGSIHINKLFDINYKKKLSSKFHDFLLSKLKTSKSFFKELWELLTENLCTNVHHIKAMRRRLFKTTCHHINTMDSRKFVHWLRFQSLSLWKIDPSKIAHYPNH